MIVPVSQGLNLIKKKLDVWLKMFLFHVLEKNLKQRKGDKFSHGLFKKSVYLKYYSSKRNHKNPKLTFGNVLILYEWNYKSEKER